MLADQVIVRAVYLDSDHEMPVPVAEADYRDVVQRASGCLWVDIEGEGHEVIEPILRKTFEFHPLAIEDALQHSHLPKLDQWDGYLSLVLHTAQAGAQGQLGETAEIDVFVGEHYVVTHHAVPTGAVERVWDAASRNRNVLARGPAHILYRVIDEAEAEFAPMLDGVDAQISRIEDEIFEHPDRALLAELFALKRSLLDLRRIIAPQRELIGKLARGAHAQFSADERMYFHDVYDHVVQLVDMLENLRDLVNSALEIYLSAASNRLNDVLKTLTIITTLFMPLSFIAGFFGMNFFQATDILAPWTGRQAFTVTLALMVVIPPLMVLWLRRRAWI